jgi:hypothetical protein
MEIVATFGGAERLRSAGNEGKCCGASSPGANKVILIQKIRNIDPTQRSRYEIDSFCHSDPSVAGEESAVVCFQEDDCRHFRGQ